MASPTTACQNLLKIGCNLALIGSAYEQYSLNVDQNNPELKFAMGNLNSASKYRTPYQWNILWKQMFYLTPRIRRFLMLLSRAVFQRNPEHW